MLLRQAGYHGRILYELGMHTRRVGKQCKKRADVYLMDSIGLKCIEIHGSSHQKRKHTQGNSGHRADKAKIKHLYKHDISLAVLWCTAEDCDWFDVLYKLLQTVGPAYFESPKGQLSGT